MKSKYKQTKKQALEEIKCLICENPYDKRVKKTRSRRYKKGRGKNTLVCSRKCSRAYERIRKHFDYKFLSKEREILTKIGVVIDEMVPYHYQREIDGEIESMYVYTEEDIKKLKKKLGIK
ncbi:hypothetical protein LCGC14_2928420 [marine sediment metagenome]|uniref:Uncharacterized protein n=1 Tax=marine sediment metagenome TaxID=412755 RepID=A0A0F8XLQ0_9ZZZZ